MKVQLDQANEVDLKAYEGLVEALVNRNMDLCRMANMDREDLVQEGTIALCRALVTFAPSLGNRFSTYATSVISNRFKVIRYNFNLFKRQRTRSKDTCYVNSRFDAMRQDYSKDPLQSVIDSNIVLEKTAHLSARDRNLVGYLMQGYTQTNIAKEFGVTKQAVSKMVDGLRKKIFLGCHFDVYSNIL